MFKRSSGHGVKGICEGIWLGLMLEELGFPVSGPMTLLCDSKAAIEIVKTQFIMIKLSTWRLIDTSLRKTLKRED